MNDRVFIDTNILVYALESEEIEKEKAERARRILRGSDLVLSTQVLGEFFNVVTGIKRKKPLSFELAAAWVQLWKRNSIEAITVSHVDLALHIVAAWKIHYYDALILAAARLADCEILYSEDFGHGSSYWNVTVCNPFLSSA